MSFAASPFLLLLLLTPLVYKTFCIPQRRGLTFLRLTLWVIFVLVLAKPHLNATEKGMDLLVVADRSSSIGLKGLNRESELLQLLSTHSERGAHDKIGVIGFGKAPYICSTPQSGLVTTEWDSRLNSNASDLHKALNLALQRSNPHRRTRILVLSDGLYTGADPEEVSLLASALGIKIDYRHVGRLVVGDFAAEKITLPGVVNVGGGFLLRYNVYAQSAGEAMVTLRRGEVVLSKGKRKLRAGFNNFFARDIISQDGIVEYELRVSAPADTVPENNTSQKILRVSTSPRLLLVSAINSKSSVLSQVLSNAKIPFDIADPEELDFSPAKLAPYRVIVLENTPLAAMGYDSAKALEDVISTGLSALLITGGENSFGQGGYHHSPIDKLLPITMELREEQRRGRMSLVAVLDRSGSMCAQTSDGRTKMQLADAGTAEAIKLLSPQDEVGVIAVDSSPHTIVGLSQADDTSSLVRAVLRIESMGGGIFVHTGLKAALKELDKSNIPNRQILLFSDAADSEEQSGCIAMAKQMQKDGIGLSVIALGSKMDTDGQFLIDLAAAGKGEVYFTNNANELPRMFSQEVIRMAMRGFVKEPTATKPLPDMLKLNLEANIKTPRLAGYNLSSLRKNAHCAMVTTDDYKSPVVAFWQKGRINSAVIMAEVDGAYSGEFVHWSKTPELITNLIRLLARGVSESDVASYSFSARGEAVFEIEVAEASASRLRALPLVARFLAPEGAKTIEAPMHWIDDTRARATLTLQDPGHYLPTVDLGADGVVRAPSLSLPYSPEYLPTEGLRGEDILASLSDSTGGRKIHNIGEAFSKSGLKAVAGEYDLTELLLWIALALLLAEIAEKRLSLGEFFLRKIRNRN